MGLIPRMTGRQLVEVLCRRLVLSPPLRPSSLRRTRGLRQLGYRSECIVREGCALHYLFPIACNVAGLHFGCRRRVHVRIWRRRRHHRVLVFLSIVIGLLRFLVAVMTEDAENSTITGLYQRYVFNSLCENRQPVFSEVLRQDTRDDAMDCPSCLCNCLN